ncbi:hypothetical protein KA082_02650 [Candidatus Woesebacteria bacterium]|nr:hypothetical protein [Candidatus Woesebacteria bacterium]
MNSPLQQGENTLVVKIPFVYSDLQTKELKYNFKPNSLDKNTFGPYKIKFDVQEFADENGFIGFNKMGPGPGENYPSVSIRTLKYSKEEIIKRE